SFLCVVAGTEGELLLVSRQGSVFKLDVARHSISPIQQLPGFTTSNRITNVLKSSSGDYYLGTLTTKVIALSSLEKSVTPHAFSDLQDNTVHALFETKEGNIWVMLNNGIDCINISSPVTRLFDKASIADVLISGGRMFLATNQGVFVGQKVEGQPVSKNIFRNVDGLEGQAWSLQEIEGRVLCSHDMGVIVLSENGYTRLNGPRGVWKIVPIRERKNEYLVCTYEGLHVMRSDGGGEFRIVRQIEGFQESSRDILESDEPGVFWLCHGYKGVFRLKIDAGYERVMGLEYFTDKNGLPSQFNINVFRWKTEIVFTTNNGIFSYDAEQNRFVPHRFLTGLFGNDKNVRQLIEHAEKTWFVHHDEIGYFLTETADPVLVKGLFLQVKGILNQSMECIKPVNENNVIIGTREGLYSFDLKYHPKDDYTTLITGVKYSDGERDVRCLLTGNVATQIPHKTLNLTFEFAVPRFDDQVNTQYSYMVDGIANTWSEWQSTPFKEYSLLPPGSYTFRVKARSLLGETAREATYAFRVTPVWYQTTIAYIAYALALAILTLFLVRAIHKRIDTVRRKTRAEEADKRKVLELELEHIKLEREKAEISKDKAILEEDVIMKSKELANYTMLLVKKRELLISLQEKLNNLRNNVRSDEARVGVNELQKMISFNLQSEEHLKVFEANFERVHSEFFRQLRKAFPDLSNKELQLCAFIKMNLTNKEIASILNLSVRGVESQRYRLRKRLAMSQDEDMAAFLEKIYVSTETHLT
ncbi:MAG TPA: triple tyrosine motif-containing protein, partial [Chryseosolibacter sp.]|nr:triple tyrosine motif-containing protein [Chryseosolibacter sp.]